MKIILLTVLGAILTAGCLSATDSNTVVLGYGCTKCNQVLEGDLREDSVLCKESAKKLIVLTNTVCSENSECFGRCKIDLCDGLEIGFICENCVVDNYPSVFYMCQNDDQAE
jgi:hypothetical protein